jgi:hypothetical protein
MMLGPRAIGISQRRTDPITNYKVVVEEISLPGFGREKPTVAGVELQLQSSSFEDWTSGSDEVVANRLFAACSRPERAGEPPELRFQTTERTSRRFAPL